ncbi:PAS domain S-box protein [Ramlibacter sp. 2FC]|uniref:sensor histidine kinase n=1 Tax=Ramlibacter sp. 2FC TaxID=2502188 RepID=UPI0010F44686|nr:PAS domain S-box protein [Ramlibacter sp. 2FC]
MVERTRAELAKREQELMRSHRLLDAITEIQSLFIRDAEPRRVFDSMLDTLLRVTDSAYGFVGEVLREADSTPYLNTLALSNIAWNETSRAMYEAHAHGSGMLFRNLDTLFGVSLRSGEAVISNTPSRDPRSGGIARGHPSLDAYLGLPVHAGGQMVGLIGLANRPGGYDEALLAYLQPLVRSCGQIIEAFRSDRERLAVMAALRESETRHKAVLDTAADAIITIDDQGRIESFNPAAERIFGWSRDEALGADIKPLLESLGLVPADLIGRGSEVAARRKDGSALPIELTVAEIALVGRRLYSVIARDIGQRKQAQAQLQRLTQSLRAIIQLSPDGFVAFDERGRLSFANPAFLRMCGCDEQDLNGMSETDFDAMLASMCDGERPYMPIAALDDGEGDILSRQQPRFTAARRSVRRLRDDEGRHLGRVVYFQDITQAAELDRMKTEFLSTAAHELRTPMASIHGFSELLLKRDFDEETRRDLLQTIYRQSSNLVRLVNELLDLARIEARQGKDFQLRRQPLQPIIDATVHHLIVPGDPRPVALQTGGALPEVEVDADKLEQALLNVLTNAYKYSPQGGAIELRTCTRTREGRLEVGIAVRDQGIGMTPEQSTRIFERFYRADDSGAIPGTGLGMSLVKEILEIHQGSVEVASALGRGADVTLWLPAAGADKPHPPAEA